MRLLLLFLLFTVTGARSQTITECRDRFGQYLNFRNSLNGLVKFGEKDITIFDAAGKKILVVYEEEIPILAAFFTQAPMQKQLELIRKKKWRKYGQWENDSILSLVNRKTPIPEFNEKFPLNGYRIAIDPGHFGTEPREAQAEQKFLCIADKASTNGKACDTVRLYESNLNFQVAKILNSRFMELGAEVFLTREKANNTSFGCTYSHWYTSHRKRILDSLNTTGKISAAEKTRYLKLNEHDFFWDFFRDYELCERSVKINNFNPHVSLIVHFNVDEKNAPWTRFSDKNFTMAFIPGSFTARDLKKPENLAHFLRLLLSDHINRSQNLALATVNRFSKELDIPIATSGDAIYLRDNCLPTGCGGVFTRNLAMCRRVNSPLVYGECLYQDNVREARMLMNYDLDMYGIKTNSRIVTVADCYYGAVLEFLRPR